MGRLRSFILVLCLLSASDAAFSEDIQSITEKARSLYQQGSFNKAVALLTEYGGVNTDVVTQTILANQLAEMGQSEYAAKNYKNAYEAFRLALKLRPTSQTATQTATEMYLKMKREMDVNNLVNEGATTVQATPQPAEPAPIVSPSDAPDTLNSLDLQAVLDQLKSAQSQLAMMESRLDLANSQNKQLQTQLASQMSVVEKMIANPKSSAALNEQDNKKLQEVINLLLEVSQKQAVDTPAPIVIEPDPRLQTTLDSLNKELQRSNENGSFLPIFGLLGLAIGGLLLVLLIVFLVQLSQARRRTADAFLSRQRPDTAPAFSRLPGRDALHLPSEIGKSSAIEVFDDSQLQQIPDSLRETLLGRDHSLACAKLARLIGRQLGFSDRQCSEAYKAGLLHDVGYLLLDKDQLQAALGSNVLNQQDLELIRSHASKGTAYFGAAELPTSVRDAILYHHERMDGSGYPKGLKGNAIPLMARIIAVADSLTALLSRRPYRNKLSIPQAMQLLRNETPTKYDPDVVNALAAVLANTPNRN